MTGPQPDYGEPGVIDPLGMATDAAYLRQPTDFAPGSEMKIDLLSRRLDAGIPLWVDGDRADQVCTETRRELFAVSEEDEDAEEEL